MRFLSVLILLVLTLKCWANPMRVNSNCPNQFSAKLVSLQGKLFFDPDGKGQWQSAHLDETLCEGSRLRVEAYSRASILLPDNVVLRLDEGTVLTLNNINNNKPTLLALLKGFVHFISRTPKHLEITSPIANAGPEGTEFAMSVNEHEARLWVYEGAVSFFNPQGRVRLTPGQGAQAETDQKPKMQITLNPHDAVSWALYYPPLFNDAWLTGANQMPLQRAAHVFRHGRSDEALFILDAIPPTQQNTEFLKLQAAMLLSVGRVQLALHDIGQVLAQQPNDAEALALQAIIALSQNNKDQAYRLAQHAVTLKPTAAIAYTALSYIEQSRFNLTQALNAARHATQLAPQDAMTWARQAELELCQGLQAESAHSAQQALIYDASLARTQTVMGFTYLMQTDLTAAKQSFSQAIQLDSASPLARLGLGLAKIRAGDVSEGRKELEIAAILDPQNSLLRSYLGKAYYEEKRNALAQEQFNLAKQLDSNDPTPYFYDAIAKQTSNRPIAAIKEMQTAIELNDNRRVYRSKLLLDQDSAAKSANFARIYTDLGFSRVALKEAWTAIAYDATNPSAHRFLSDAYIGQPRYKVARASELLQAQLLQPLNITPVQPQLTSENIGILNSTGPGSLSVNEYDSLFNANGAHLVLNGAYGTNNTKTDNAIVSGLYNKLSMSLGQFHYQTDGFRQNDAYQQNIYDAFAQYAVTSDLSVQLELKSDETHAGDVPFRLNEFHQENLKKTIEQNTIRIGGHYRISPAQDVITSSFYTHKKNTETNSLQSGVFVEDDSTRIKGAGYQTEMQYIFHPALFDFIGGIGYTQLKNTTSIKKEFYFPSDPPISLCPEFCANSISKPKTDYVNGYIYSKQYILPNLTTTLGFSYDSYDDSFTKEEQANPKLGVIWNPLKNLTLRSAFFRSLNRPLVSNQTIEPTQVAGFNQFFDGNNGTSAWQYGFGLDYQLIDKIFLGGEINWRDIKRPTIENEQLINQNRREASHLAYFYWLPFDWMSVHSEYRYETYTRSFLLTTGNPTNPASITTQQVPLSLNLFQNNGLFAKLTGTYVNQKVAVINDNLGLDKENESFWTFDATLGFRLPRKLGLVSIEARNLLNEQFHYQSTFDASGPQLSPFVPERQLFAKLSLFY